MNQIYWDQLYQLELAIGDGRLREIIKFPPRKGYGDEKIKRVPANLIKSYIDRVYSSASQKSWILLKTEVTEAQTGIGPFLAKRYVWVNGEKNRLEYWNTDENNTEMSGGDYIALLIDNEYCIVGCVLDHPFVICDWFSFDNTDGSTDYDTIATIDAAHVLQALKSRYLAYIFDQQH